MEPKVPDLNHAQLANSLGEVSQAQLCLVNFLATQRRDKYGNLVLSPAQVASLSRTLAKTALVVDRVSILLDQQVEIKV